MYKVYCHSFNYSKIVASKAEAVETFKQYYLEMNEKINEFHLNPVGMGICPFTKS